MPCAGKRGTTTMKDALEPKTRQIDRVELPGWAQYLMVLAGLALLVGPTLAVLWPR